MASDDGSIPDDERWQKIKDFRKFRELFRGRFSDEEAKILMRVHDWNLGRTVMATLHATPRDLRDLLRSNDVEERISLVTGNDVHRELARRHEIANEIRQYTCEDCNKMWWRRVSTRKPISRCFTCKTKYDPLPRDREWGLGEFECECGQTFRGMGAMGKTDCMCYRCGRMCPILRILPPLKRDNQSGTRRNRHKHSCNGHNCYNRSGPADPNKVCVHPKSNPIRVLHGSHRHVSTGSTVNTFLNQDDIEPRYEPSLADIIEEDDSSRDSSDSD